MRAASGEIIPGASLIVYQCSVKSCGRRTLELATGMDADLDRDTPYCFAMPHRRVMKMVKVGGSTLNDALKWVTWETG
jgi:hypothetical protein